ncbi:MAG: long-chain fatty acid--CoA ligase [Solirubrobacterales bacterium]|nr:long-chain fatty acid--CoA ligase [Solirubrobacterales bacterium]
MSGAIRGLTMDCQLTIPAIARRAEAIAPDRAVVARQVDGTLWRGSWSSVLDGARRLAVALEGLGVGPGDRVATLCWNQREHLEAYFGVPALGAVLHTLNTRVSADDLAFMIADAGARTLIVDDSLLGLLADVRPRVELDRLIVVGDAVSDGALRYDELTAAADPARFAERDIDERDACALCYTSGTTGRPKGVLYSHRAIAIQSLATMAVDFGGVREADTILVVVPMFHGNAWGHPYAAALAGAGLVLPHRDLAPRSLLELIAGEGVTVTGGVPTVWTDVLGELDAAPGGHDVSSLRVLRIGGARAPMELLRGLEERHGIPVLAGFGMTEMSPIGGISTLPHALASLPAEERWAERARTGRPMPFMEVRVRGEEGLAAWDGETAGELEYRGPSVASGYWRGRDPETFTDDGWLRSGDIGVVTPHGVIDIRDRAKDVIKSGGEWISSVALEQALVTHPQVADAAVVAIAHPRWQERPLAAVVLAPGARLDAAALRAHLEGRVPRWWLPDRFEAVTEIPRTAVGKIRKNVLRDRLAAAGHDRGEETA